MCVNQRLLKTRYMTRPVYVNCGRCPACLQQKASRRVYRINNHRSVDLGCLMVGLTYSRGTSPYVDRNEAYEFSSGLRTGLNIYRDCIIRKVRKPRNFNQYNQVYKRLNKRVVLDSVDFVEQSSLAGTKDMAHEFGKISVNYYKDYQSFLARLRLNLKRHYNYEKNISVYACSEYGIRSDRSHFHLLVFFDKSDKEIVKSAIYESWPFSDLRKFPRAVEEPLAAASYVASYVNQRRGFSSFLKDYFPSRHSYSKGFGTSLAEFSLSNIMACVDKGFISYRVLKNINGIPTPVSLPIPKYIISRFFPVFKGYTRFTPSKVLQSSYRVATEDYGDEDLIEYDNQLGYTHHFVHIDGINYDPLELHRISVRLKNAWKRFNEFYRQVSLDVYLDYYRKVWNCYKSSVLRLFMERNDIPLLEKYDNLDNFVNGSYKFSPVGFDVGDIKITDPNKFLSVINLTNKYQSDYFNNIKHRDFANLCYLSTEKDCEL